MTIKPSSPPSSAVEGRTRPALYCQSWWWRGCLWNQRCCRANPQAAAADHGPGRSLISTKILWEYSWGLCDSNSWPCSEVFSNISAIWKSLVFFSVERSTVNSVWKSPPWSYCPPMSRQRATGGALPSRHLHTAWRNWLVTAWFFGEKSVSMVFSKGAIYLFIYLLYIYIYLKYYMMRHDIIWYFIISYHIISYLFIYLSI